MQTLFIVREKDAPLKPGDTIIAQGFQRYDVVVKKITSSKEMKNGKVQWTIKGTRTAIQENVG